MVPSFGVSPPATLTVRVAGPDPLSGPLREKKSAEAVPTVQPHPGGAAIVSVADPPAGPNAAGDRVDSNPQGSVNTAAAFHPVPGPGVAVASVVLDEASAAICLRAVPA